jgi:hypothetical protein
MGENILLEIISWGALFMMGMGMGVNIGATSPLTPDEIKKRSQILTLGGASVFTIVKIIEARN